MQDKLKIAPHAHSGRLIHHRHTSYPLVALILIIAGLLFAGISVGILADHPPPQSGSIGLEGVVPEKPPNVAATITQPTNGQHFTTMPVTVAGTCTKNLIVEIFANDTFVGSAVCGDNGKYTIDVALIFGPNTLKAVIHDQLDQAGPDSNLVTVYNDIAPIQIAGLNVNNLTDIQMLLATSPVYRGIFPGQEVAVPLQISGGKPPYAVNVDWGSSSSSLISRSDNAPFKATYTYQKPGFYPIAIRATDVQQHSAFLQVVAIVNGKAQNNGQAAASSAKNRLLIAWPFFIAVVLMVIGFWLGERREKAKLENEMAENMPAPTPI